MTLQSTLATMHRMSTKQRVDIGILIEEWARRQINAQMLRYKWERTPGDGDTRKKQDWMTFNRNNKRINAQFKGRITGNDILVCVMQPFHGVGNPNTLMGRDMVGEDISYYITYPPMSEHILISKARDVKAICEGLVQEFVDRDGFFPFRSRKFRNEDSWCELRYKLDEGDGNRTPKMLAFLPPTLVPNVKLKVDPNDFESWMASNLQCG